MSTFTGITFYLEHKTPKAKKQGNHSGNVIAVFGDTFYSSFGKPCKECISAIFFDANSAVSSSAVSEQYLEENCKRISLKEARAIHPKLFEYLEMDEQQAA